MSAVYWTGQLPVKKEGRVGTTGGGWCCSWEPILSLLSDWLLDSESRRQQCSEGRTVAATRRDLSSASSSAVFPLFPEAQLQRHTSSNLPPQPQSGGPREKKKNLTCSFCSRGICLACSGTNLVYLQKYVSVQLHRAQRRSTGKSSDAHSTLWHRVDVCVHVFPGIRADQSKSFKRRGGKEEWVRDTVRERAREGEKAREREQRNSRDGCKRDHRERKPETQ